jgi:hypothetical protein
MYCAGWQRGRAEIPLDMLPQSRSRPGRKREAAVCSFGDIHLLPKCDRRFLGRLRRGPHPRRWLQQTLSRYFIASIFHLIHDRLVAEGYLFLHDSIFYLTRKGVAAMGYTNASMSGFVEFVGNSYDSSGLPVPYRKYWIILTPGPAARSCMVTITALTRMTPVLETNSFCLRTGSSEEAFRDVVGRLTALFPNRSLRCRILD